MNASPRPQCADHAAAILDASALQGLLLANDTLEQFLNELVVTASRITGHLCSVTARARQGTDAYTVASSDKLTRRLDELQYTDGRGPCLEALRTAAPVFVNDMATEPRWAPYPQHALRTGAHSAMSFPLIADSHCIGALNLYATTAQMPSAELQARVAGIAAHAAGALPLALRIAERDDLIKPAPRVEFAQHHRPGHGHPHGPATLLSPGGIRPASRGLAGAQRQAT